MLQKVLSEMQGADVMVGKYSSKSFVTYIPYDHMRDKVIGIVENTAGGSCLSSLSKVALSRSEPT